MYLKKCCFFQRIGEGIFCFFLSAIFLSSFSVLFFFKECVWQILLFLNSFWNSLLILFFSSHFSHEKNQPRNLHFLFLLSPFCFTFAFNIFPFFLSSLFLSSFFLPFYLFIPFCFSPLFPLSHFSILSFYLYLCLCFSFSLWQRTKHVTKRNEWSQWCEWSPMSEKEVSCWRVFQHAWRSELMDLNQQRRVPWLMIFG